MPSRKGNASDATLANDSRRSSLRRLSSIASFQTLFTRRRSQNITDDVAASSSSNISLSSTSVTNAPAQSVKGSVSSSTTNLLQSEDSLAELPSAPQPTHASTRRGSYFCLPDDPIGGMPRSRTFSNLPLPTRAKKTPSIVGSTKSHSRLPSALLPSTRLPSPPSSTRKHSHSRLMSAETKGAVNAKNRMQRSDTEPLLGMGGSRHVSNLPRSTAFKENISLSPIKPLPALDMSYDGKHYMGQSPPLRSQYHPPGAWVSSSSAVGQMLSSSIPSTASWSPSPPLPISKYESHPAIQMVREHKSSPARPLYRSAKDRQPTPGASALDPISRGAPVQRWNSQPLLITRQNKNDIGTWKDSKHHGEIKQTRLMSARQAPTPPQPKTPISTKAAAAGSKVKAANNSATAGHVRQLSEQSPSQTIPTQPSSIPPETSAQQITHHEPPAYWAGRLSALADRYRNEELATLLSDAIPSAPTSSSTTTSDGTRSLKSIASFAFTGPSTSTGATLTPKAQTDKMHTPAASTARLKRALDLLNSVCATQEAKDSLAAFQMEFSAVMKLPELRPPKPVLRLGNSTSIGAGGDGAEKGGAGSMSESRKASFMDRLLGRGGQGKRRSLVLV